MIHFITNFVCLLSVLPCTQLHANIHVYSYWYLLAENREYHILHFHITHFSNMIYYIHFKYGFTSWKSRDAVGCAVSFCQTTVYTRGGLEKRLEIGKIGIESSTILNLTRFKFQQSSPLSRFEKHCMKSGTLTYHI